MGIDYLFGGNMKVAYGIGIHLHNPFDIRNKNPDFDSYGDFHSQYFLATTANINIYYYKNLTPNVNIFFALGGEILYSNGQSLYIKIINLIVLY